MSISSVGNFLNAIAPGGAAVGRQSSSRSDSLSDTMREIREQGGLSAWAHQQRIDALKDKLRQEVMTSKGLDASALFGAHGVQRASVEAEIGQMVAQKLKETMERTAAEAAGQGRTQAVLLNIMV